LKKAASAAFFFCLFYSRLFLAFLINTFKEAGANQDFLCDWPPQKKYGHPKMAIP
jgi:hypothetical protein